MWRSLLNLHRVGPQRRLTQAGQRQGGREGRRCLPPALERDGASGRRLPRGAGRAWSSSRGRRPAERLFLRACICSATLMKLTPSCCVPCCFIVLPNEVVSGNDLSKEI